MTRIFLQLFLSICGFCLFAFEVRALDDISGTLRGYEGRDNQFADYVIPSRQRLLDKAPLWPNELRRRRRLGPRPSDCGNELLSIARGFSEIYPEAPNPITSSKADMSWLIHVELVRFRDLYICKLRHDLRETLQKIKSLGLKLEPIPWRINASTYNFEKLRDEPRVVRRLKSIIADLVWLSYKGYWPAMLELLKLSNRDDIIRLTPRFSYYLLAVLRRTKRHDLTIERMQRNFSLFLSARARSELEIRARDGKWPREDRMVLD